MEGLAAWIVEKFRTWSDCDGDVERRFSKDVLLTNVILYWVTGAINASFWPYWARRHEPWPISELTPVRVPTAYASFPREILHPPRAWVERTYVNLRRWTAMEAGGHFADSRSRGRSQPTFVPFSETSAKRRRDGSRRRGPLIQLAEPL